MILDRQMAAICTWHQLTMHVYKSGRIELRKKANGDLVKVL